MSRFIKNLAAVLFVWLALSACSPAVKITQPAKTALTPLDARTFIGQTFTSRNRGLEGIAIYLEPQNPGAGEIELQLFPDTSSTQPITTASLSLERIDSPGFYRFDFPPQTDSFNKDYYLNLAIRGKGDGSGSLLVGNGPGESYLDGALYENGEPLDKQLTFRLIHDSAQMWFGIVLEGFTWLGWLIVAGFLFVLPGWALFNLLWKEWREFDWREKLGLSAGLSVAIYPLLILWTDLLGLKLGAIYAWLPPILGLGIISWRGYSKLSRSNLRNLPNTAVKSVSSRLRNEDSTFFWTNLLFISIIGLLAATRFWVIRGLDLPLWGDSYQHSMITQLFIDNDGLFTSWQPYAPLSTFTYHFGFHASAAVLMWITGVSSPQAVLVGGQFLNILAILALYPLATRVTKNHWAGMITILIAGLLSPMPMFYVNWGRYTQLAGQVVLPVAVFLFWHILEKKENDWPLIALAWIALGGLALSHFRVLILGVLFFVAYFFITLFSNTILRTIKRTFWIGSGGALLFLPWFIHVFGGKILRQFTRQITTPAAQTSSFTQSYNDIGDIYVYLPAFLWITLPLFLGWGLWYKRKDVALISLWWFGNLLAANPQWLNLPGVGSISSFAVMIAAYFPVSLIFGITIPQIAQGIYHHLRSRNNIIDKNGIRLGNFSYLPLILIVITIALFGARLRVKDLSTQKHSLATRADIRAAQWIRENTPKEARFLVNSFFAYGGTAVVGADGGWWLPLLAERDISIPPLNYGFEQGFTKDYAASINRLASEIEQKGLGGSEVLTQLEEEGIGYIYIGQRQGAVNNPAPASINSDLLIEDERMELIYHQDRVWIFEIEEDF